MSILIRKARETDLPQAAAIYDRILDRQERGLTYVGWLRGVYPTLATAQAAFHNVRVDGALCQKVYSTDLLGLVLKHTDELFANDFTLALRLGNTGQLAVKTFAGVHADKVDVELAALAEHFANLLTFVLAQQAVVNNHAG